MSTIRQKRFVKKMLESAGKSEPITLGQLAVKSGFSPAVAKSPARIMRGKGVLELFEKAGVSGEKLAEEWNKVLKAQPEKPISWDSKIKGLAHISTYILENKDKAIEPRLQFISKFINLNLLGQSKPKNRQFNEK